MIDPLRLDPKRINAAETGIFVHAVDLAGKWGSHDLSRLDRASFLAFLRSRDAVTDDGGRAWRESVLLVLFGHQDEQT